MNTLHVVDCATCGETIRTLTIFGEVYPRLDWEIIQKDVFPHGIVIERWFEHLLRFQYSFPECKSTP
jgi:hypothetical protein